MDWILFVILYGESTRSQVIVMENQKACLYAKQQIKELNDFTVHVKAVCFPVGTEALPKLEKRGL